MSTLRLGILASGRGSNFAGILSSIQKGKLDAEVRVLVSNKKRAGALELARENRIPDIFLSHKVYFEPEQYDAALERILTDCGVNFVALAGYLKYLTPRIITKFRNRILNMHPALLPSFGGKGMYGSNVHKAVLERGCKVSGATVHLVDEVYDHGPIIVQQGVPVLGDDTPESLAARVLKVEHKIYSEALQYFAEDRVRIEGLRARILPNA